MIILLFTYYVNRFYGFYFPGAKNRAPQERYSKEPGEQYAMIKKTHPGLAGGPDINLIRISRPYGLLSPAYPGDNR